MTAEALFDSVSIEDQYAIPNDEALPYLFLPNGSLVPSEDAILIAVMGVTGAGKSQFINTLKAIRISNNSDQARPAEHEKYATVGKKLESETRCIEFFHLRVDNRNVILIDTPGFNDRDRSDTEILQDLATWLTDTFAKNRLLSGICYMHNITNPRFDATATDNSIMLHKLCGSAGMEIVALMTSMWDKCHEDQAVEVEFNDHEKELREKYWEELLEDGARMMRTYNNFSSNMECIKSIIENNHRRILALQYQISKEGRRLPATDIGAHVMTKAHSSELVLKHKLAQLDQLEAQREQQNLAPSKTLAKQREKLEQNLADARRDQAALENWTWKDVGDSALVTFSGGMGGFFAVGGIGAAAESAISYATATAFVVADVVAIPLLALGAVGVATVGGIWWHQDWKERRAAAKTKALQKIKDLQLQKKLHDDEVKKEAELIEQRNAFDFRMRLIQEVFMQSWRSSMPRDPNQLKRMVEDALPQNFAGDNRHIIICGWQLPTFCRELIEKTEMPSLETLKQVVEQTSVIASSHPHFEITTIGSYITTKWGRVGIELLRDAVITSYAAIIEGRETEHPLAATWPPDLLSRSATRLYTYSKHVILQLSSTDPACNVLEINKAAVQALLWLCQATRVQTLDCEGPELSRQLREIKLVGGGGQIQPPRVSLYPLAKLEVIKSSISSYCCSDTVRIIVTETNTGGVVYH